MWLLSAHTLRTEWRNGGVEAVTTGIFGTKLSVPYILFSSIARNVVGDAGGLFKYISSTTALTSVVDATGVLTYLDGMKFNEAHTILYGTRNSLAGVKYNTVVAAISCDGWQTAMLAYTFQTNCEGGSDPSALALIENVYGVVQCWVWCRAVII
jgi:hypothetical protein